MASLSDPPLSGPAGYALPIGRAPLVGREAECQALTLALERARTTTELVMCCWRIPPSLARYSAATRALNISGEIFPLKRDHSQNGGSMTPEGNVPLELDDIQSGVLRPRPTPYAATYIVLRIEDRNAGRELMRRVSTIVTSAANPTRPLADTWVSVALTYPGRDNSKIVKDVGGIE